MTTQAVKQQLLLVCLCGNDIDVTEKPAAVLCPQCHQMWEHEGVDAYQTVEPDPPTPPKWSGGDFECDICSYPEDVGSFYCCVHRVKFRGDIDNPPLVCPAGLEYGRGYDDAAREAEDKWEEGGSDWMFRDSNIGPRRKNGRYAGDYDECPTPEPVHLLVGIGINESVTACDLTGSPGRDFKVTTEDSEVTCPLCLKEMGR